jgi:hypothetical protein
MSKFKSKTAEIDAWQFTGSNGPAIQNAAGSHAIDPSGKYLVPNFDYASTWWPEAPEGVVAVLWVNKNWTGVSVNDWLVRNPNGELEVYADAEFKAKFDAVV